jgi:hypothetical protein
VLDFGLARIEAIPGITQTGVILGTPAYVAPEQARGMGADFRSDIFSFGIVLYELASGVNPFAGRTVTETIARIIEQDPQPLSSVQRSVPPELDSLVSTCLRKNPDERCHSTEDIVVELEQLQAEIAPRRPSTATVLPLPRRTSKARQWWVAHQFVISAVYAAMLYPAWYARRSLPEPWTMAFLLTVLAATAANMTLRLHLCFAAWQALHGDLSEGELVRQQAWTQVRTRWCDVVLAVAQIAAALVISRNHPEFAMLFVGVATASLVVSYVIEPTTARAAFSRSDISR